MQRKDCLFFKNQYICKILKSIECEECGFYLKDTRENRKKLLEAEKDIRDYYLVRKDKD